LQPAAVRGAVGVVALDQWRGYLGQVRDLLPRAEVVVDHFHLMRLANQLVTEVGQRTQQEVSESCHHSPSISLLTEWQQTGIGPPVWPPDQWSITKDQVQEFVEIDILLNNDPDSIDAGMERFHALVTSRANWLFDHAMKCVPDAKLFSADAPVDAREIPLTAHWTDWLRSGRRADVHDRWEGASTAATTSAIDLTWSGSVGRSSAARAPATWGWATCSRTSASRAAR
jgi:hypothetical protein